MTVLVILGVGFGLACLDLGLNSRLGPTSGKKVYVNESTWRDATEPLTKLYSLAASRKPCNRSRI